MSSVLRLFAILFVLIAVVPGIAVPAVAAPAPSAEAEAPASFGVAAMPLDMVERRTMPKVYSAALAAQAEWLERGKWGEPYRFADPLAVDMGTYDSGTWEILADGSRLWRLRIVSPGAVNLNLGFSKFDLPAGARLWLYDPAGQLIQGPFEASDRSAEGRFYTPIVEGDEIVLELHVPAGSDRQVHLEMERLNQGFRDLAIHQRSHGSCNIDVICPEGDAWRDQIRSVARYTINGSTACTGQIVNNTAQDDTPYFLSAFHCDVSAANDDTVVVYWNYESPTCGQQGGGSLDQNQSGSTYLSGDEVGDFLLVELDEVPNPAFNVHYTGWNVSGQAPGGSVGIHHPSADVKSISFNTDPLTTIGWDPINGQLVPSGDDHWMVDDWEEGTTEGGSSGSCIWDPANGLCVGVLTAGLASCEAIDFDIYGKLSYAWESAGDAPDRRLRDWLDPLDLGSTALPGKDPGDVEPPTCLPSQTSLCLGDDRFRVEVEWTDFVGTSGSGRVAPASSDDSGVLWFFDSSNWEILVKVLDRCDTTGHFWVFSGATTNVEYTLTVTDTVEGAVKTYFNPLGNAAASVMDMAAFAGACGDNSTGQSSPSYIRLDAPAPPGVSIESQGSATGGSQTPARVELSPFAVASPKQIGALPKACVDQFIDCGSTVQSNLDTSDCEFGDGTYFDVWVFDGAAGQQVDIDLTSSDFDTFLALLDPALEQLDGDGGPGLMSAGIDATLTDTGEWVIIVNNFSEVAGDPGSYSLSLACSEVTADAPEAPSNLAAEVLSSSEIDLSWDDNSNNESDFEVQIRIAGMPFESLGTVPANTTGGGVTGLEPETTYDFRVRARNQIGNSAWSNTATATTEAGCVASDSTLCLLDGRFQAQVHWADFAAESGSGEVVPFSSDASGIFWFFAPDNWEMLVKMVDGCSFNGHYWLFAAGLTNVEYFLTVTDTQTGARRFFLNPLGSASPAMTETVAFACQ